MIRLLIFSCIFFVCSICNAVDGIREYRGGGASVSILQMYDPFPPPAPMRSVIITRTRYIPYPVPAYWPNYYPQIHSPNATVKYPNRYYRPSR